MPLKSELEITTLHDFPLTFHTDYGPILFRFRDTWRDLGFWVGVIWGTVIKSGTMRKLGYGFLFAFYSNYGRIFSRSDTIHERDGHASQIHQTTA